MQLGRLPPHPIPTPWCKDTEAVEGKPLEVKFYLMNDCNDINPLPHSPVTPQSLPTLSSGAGPHHIIITRSSTTTTLR